MISEFALFLFTLLGGTAAGAYVFAWAFPMGEGKKRWVLPLVSLILLAIGGVALLMHLGHPERMFLAFSNPQSGITREALATGPLGVLVLVDFILGLRSSKPAPKALGIVTAIAGVLLLVAMGSAYVDFHGVPAWANWTSMALFVVGGLSVGASILPLFDTEIARKNAFAVCAAVLNVLFACTAIATGMHFAANGFSIMPFICGAVVAVAAAVVAYMAKNREGITMPALAFVLAFVAVAIVRYAFYTAV